MRILYVVSRPLEINTSASIRNNATIKGLIANGCDVELITTEPDVNHPAYDSGMKLEEVTTHYIKLGGVQAIAKSFRKIRCLSPIKRFLYRFMNRVNIYDNLVTIVKHIDEMNIDLNNYDVIISSSDPKSSHLFVYELLRQNVGYNGKWIQIWGDPFVGDISAELSRNNKKVMKEEHKLISAADEVIYVSELTLEQQITNYPDCKMKMKYLPIPYLEELIYDNQELFSKTPIYLAYCGDYNSNVRNIRPIYNVVKENERYNIIIRGLSDLCLSSLSNVDVGPRVGRKNVLEIEKNADILVHLSNASGSQIPGKIYQYAATNKPILFILDGEEEKLRNTFEIYDRVVFTKNNEESIKVAIEQIIQDDKQYTPLREFSKEFIAKEIINSIY